MVYYVYNKGTNKTRRELIKMKFIKTIEQLAERAERNGVAILRRRDFYSQELQEVYRVTFNKENGAYDLFHYGTLTCRVRNDVVKHVYGESVSDADSIGTFIQSVTNSKVCFGYRPVNGGFYLYDRTTEKEIFYSRDTLTEILNTINRYI